MEEGELQEKPCDDATDTTDEGDEEEDDEEEEAEEEEDVIFARDVLATESCI